MQQERERYIEKGIITFSIPISQQYDRKTKKYKKVCGWPTGWQLSTINNSEFKTDDNGLCILTGKENNLFVLDIDNNEHWKQFLKKNRKKEPNTVKALSGSGGTHLYFKYDEDLDDIKTSTKVFGDEYDIDVRTNKGNIIAPPSTYYNKKLKKDVQYTWIVSIFDKEPDTLPDWIKEKLGKKKNIKQVKKGPIKKNKDGKPKKQIIELKNIENTEKKEGNYLKFNYNDYSELINMLDSSRCSNYSDWLDVGMCLYNINKNYLGIWDKWSSKDPKYEESKCEEKWNSFKNDKNGLKIGSLRSWCKNDNPKKYNNFINTIRREKFVITKYSDTQLTEKLIFGEHVVNGQECIIKLKNKKCFIKGCEHNDCLKSFMFVSVSPKLVGIKCTHPDCFARSYPTPFLTINNIEFNQVNNYYITNTINISEDEKIIEFNKINLYKDDELNKLVYNTLVGTKNQNAIAELMYYFCKDDYIYTIQGIWYVFEESKWEDSDNLKKLINEKSKEIYNTLGDYYKENKEDEKKIKKVNDLIDYCGNAIYKTQIIEEIITHGYDKKKRKRITLSLDSNLYLIGFDNGVYDFEKMIFRKAKREDYVSMTVGYDYKETYSDYINDLIQFLEDILPIKEDREYLLQYLANSMIGNQHELMSILTGNGRNGKSKLIELLELTFGEYCDSIIPQMFTRPRPSAQSPDPGLLDLINRRYIIASEPEKGETLNTSFLKFLTGRDGMKLRECHSNTMMKFRPNFVPFLVCNDIPETNGSIDNAFATRLRCINFPTEFKDNPTEKHHKKLKRGIHKNFKYWKNDFFLLLVEYYKKNPKNEEIFVPENITKWTDMYKEDVDIYLQFMNEELTKTDNEKDRIFITDLYANFRCWLKVSNPTEKIPSNKAFTKNLRRLKINIKRVRIGEDSKDGFSGFSFNG